MELKLLSDVQLEQVYHAHMVRDFPKSELKPLRAIRSMIRAGSYWPYGCFEGEQLLGYAFLTGLPGGSACLLDYLAVLPQLRCAGVGTHILAILHRALAERWSGILVEAELPEKAPDALLAARRLNFYQRAGFRQLPMGSRVFGVEYVNLLLPCGGALDDPQAARQLEEIYRDMVPEPYYSTYVSFYEKERKEE